MKYSLRQKYGLATNITPEDFPLFVQFHAYFRQRHLYI